MLSGYPVFGVVFFARETTRHLKWLVVFCPPVSFFVFELLLPCFGCLFCKVVLETLQKGHTQQNRASQNGPTIWLAFLFESLWTLQAF